MSFRHLHKYLRFKLSKKIVLGSAGIHYSGWLLTNKDSLDITKSNDFARYWKPNSRRIFLAEHVWEHLTDDGTEKANANCFEFLISGGRLRIAVPDGFHPDLAYIDYVRPGGIGAGAEDHKVLYNYKTFRKTLQRAGFEVCFLEYWDESGQFHFHDWSSKDGHVRRSRRYDPRNQDGSLTYTSLIADAMKA